MGYGLSGAIPINVQWRLSIGLDGFKYDLENPAKILGIASASEKVIDAKTSSTMLSLSAERYLQGTRNKAQVFWAAGMAINKVDVEEASGPVIDGERFRIRTKVDNEYVAQAKLGLDYPVQQNWLGRASVGINYHFADWQLEDSNSGVTGSIGNYMTWDLQLGVSYHFD